MFRLGIDIGGTKIQIGILDEEKNLICHKKVYIKDVEDLPGDLRRETELLCRENGICYEDIISCGIGVPGTVSRDGRTLLHAPNIAILPRNMAEQMEESLKIPVSLIQDSRAAAWGEYLCGAGQGMKSVICFTLGTGIGTGIVLNGQIYSGDLGCAGEIGHTPVEENGRSCGCGKRGCLEKYAAGGGLTITACELLGEGKTAEDLFGAAQAGNEKARIEIKRAMELLGSVLVSVVNFISPECLLFSGGLSGQEELYLNPLIDYIKAHCYSAGRIPRIEKARLGEYSPLYGAALVPVEEKKKPRISASIMCADLCNLEKALEEIEKAGIQYIHCDIMDNHFVPNLMLPPEMLNRLREVTDLPFDFHIMTEKPETVIEQLKLQEKDIVSVHYESTPNLQRVLTLVKERGATASAAVNPATPVEALREVLEDVSMVLVMTVNPGFAGQKMVPASIDKIRRLRKMLDGAGRKDIAIEVDGNCSFENVPKMYEAGADMFVAGSSSVFHRGYSVTRGTEKLLALLR